jgi:hypothetical protein
MSVRCDKAMRRSKERVREIKGLSLPKWKCTKDCANCICGIIRDKSGNEHHVNLLRGKANAEIHNTAETDHEEK